MDNITPANIITVISLVALGGWNIFLHIQNRPGRDADTIEKLTASIDVLYSRQDELQAQLDNERAARRIAEVQLSDLQRRFVVLETDNKNLVFENTALKDALDISNE